MPKCRACVGGAEGRAGVGEAGCAASAQRTQTTGDADLTACARTSRLPARTSRLLARTSRLRARADCVGVRAAARADRAAARAPLGASYARATLTHRRFLKAKLTSGPRDDIMWLCTAPSLELFGAVFKLLTGSPSAIRWETWGVNGARPLFLVKERIAT